MKHHVGKLQDYPPGTHKCIMVNSKSIGVFNIEGELYALRNYCPHQSAPLCEGLVTPWISASEPYRFDYEREGEIVRCPWHQWEFDIKSGRLVVDPKIRTLSYDIVVERFELSVDDGEVYILA